MPERPAAVTVMAGEPSPTAQTIPTVGDTLATAERGTRNAERATTENVPATITGSNEGKASAMPAEAGATPAPEQSSGKANAPRPGDVIEATKTEPPQPAGGDSTQAPPPEPVKPVRVARGMVARTRFDNESARLPSQDILAWIADNMPLASKTEARKKGADWWQKNASLYDDAPGKLPPHHNLIYRGRTMPDVVAEAAYRDGMLKSPDVGELWNAIRRASDTRNGLAKADEKFNAAMDAAAKEHKNWLKATKAGEVRVTAEDLVPGDILEVGGERVKVKARDPHTGELTLEDGKKFGVQKLEDGESIYVENVEGVEGSGSTDWLPPEDVGQASQPAGAGSVPAPVPTLRPGEAGTGEMFQGADQPFNLSGDKATDGDRIAAERAAEAQRAAEAAAFAAKHQQELPGTRGTSAVGDPMMPPIPPGVPGGTHSGGRMPVAMERIVPGHVDVPTVMRTLENVVRATGGESPIRTGRFYAHARGIFKTFSEVIRIREADNIPTAAHEVAHAVSKQIFGSPMSRDLIAAMKGSPHYGAALKELRALGHALYGSTRPAAGYTAEGFAEFVREWITTEDAGRKAPATLRWFEGELLPKTGQLGAALKQAREAIDVWRGQGAMGRAEAQLKGPESRLRVLKDTVLKYFGREGHVEEFSPLEELSRGFEQVTGKRLPPSKDPFMLATARRGAAGGILENFVERGTQDIWGNLTGPSLKEAMARIKPEEAKNFSVYLWARRAQERWAKGKNPGMSPEDAAYLRTKLETPAFMDAASKYYAWWDGVLEYVKQASPETNGPMIDAIRAGSGDYAPLARVLDPARVKTLAAGAGGGGLYKMHGSGLPVREIFLSTLQVAERMISRAHKDMVLDAVFNLSKTEGMGWLVERVPRSRVMESLNIEKIRRELESLGVDTTMVPDDTLLKYATHLDKPSGSDPIMVRMVGGTPEWYQVPAKVHELLEGIDPVRLGKVADIFLGMPARSFKLGTTGLRAAFSLVTNPARDLPTFYLQSITGNPAARTAHYFGALFDIVRAGMTGKESPEWQAFKQLGIGTGNFLGGDIQQAKREARALFHGKVFRRVASPVETLREALSFSEATPRLAEMTMMGKEFGWQPGQPMTPDAAIAMTVAAKRVTTDFTAGGKYGKLVNQAVPFYNANIQGTRAFLRAFQSEQGVKVKNYAAARAVATGLTLITLPVIYNWWRNKDKEWYRNLPYRERYLYHNIEGPDGVVVQVPKPQEWGNAFGVVPEMLLDSWYQRDPRGAQEGLKFIFATPNPADYPVLLKVAKEQWQNRIDFFDRPIVPQAELNLPAGQQRAYFSSLLAKSLGDAFPNTVSPRRVDSAVRGLFGGLGSDVMDAPSMVLRALGKEEQTRPPEPADIPVFGRLFRRGGEFSANGRFLGDFWDQYLQSQAQANGIRHRLNAAQPGQPPAPLTAEELTTLTRADWFQAHHAVIKIELDMATRVKDATARQNLYREASRMAEKSLKLPDQMKTARQ